MFDVGGSLQAAMATARRRLGEAEATLARANAGQDADRRAAGAMAQTAQAAIFCEALLAAQHARFAEIKAVTK